MFRSMLENVQRQQRAETRRGQSRENRQRVDVAFVQNARARCTPPASATTSRTHRLPSELWNAFAAPWKFVLMVDGSVRFGDFLNLDHRVAERLARLQSERNRHRRKLAIVVDGLRTHVLRHLRHRIEGDQLVVVRL